MRKTVGKGGRQQGRSDLSPEAAAEQAERDLETGRFREASEGYRRLLKTEARPAWKAALARAYVGRARALAAKSMYREAAALLADADAADGAVHEPQLQVACLWRAGDQAKAAETAGRLSVAEGLSEADRTGLADVTAVLRLCTRGAVPPGAMPVDADPQAPAERALTAWVDGRPEAEVDAALAAIPMRSPYRPLRLALKTLTSRMDATRRRALLAMTTGAAGAGEGAFAGFVAAVRTALEEDPDRALAGLAVLGRHGRSFVTEVRAGHSGQVRALVALLEAEARGPEALFDAVATHSDVLPRNAARRACLDLLTKAPSRRSAFERRFGHPTEFEELRRGALAARVKGDWPGCRDRWLAYAEAALATGDPDQRLEAALVYRYLADATLKGAPEPGRYGGWLDGGDPIADWLTRSAEADPETPDTLEMLADRLADIEDFKRRDRVLEDAVKAFPKHPGLLLRALDAAAGRGAQQKAAGLAERLIAIDPINTTARQRLAEARLAHARKKLAEGRWDLAAKALDGVTTVERGAAGGLAALVCGFLTLRRDGDPAAWDMVRRGVERLGGGVAGWVRAILEGRACGLKDAELKPAEAALTQAAGVAAGAPSDAVAALTALNRPEYRGLPLSKSSRLGPLRAWLQRAAGLPYTVDEFVSVADALSRLDEWKLLRIFAAEAVQRDRSEPVFAFFVIVARAEGKANRLGYGEFDRLETIAERAAETGNARLVARLRKFLGVYAASPAISDELEGIDGFGQEMLGQIVDMLTGGSRLPTPLITELAELAFELLMEGEPPMEVAAILMEEFDGHPLLRGWSKAKLTKELTTMIDGLQGLVHMAQNMASPPIRKRGRR